MKSDPRTQKGQPYRTTPLFDKVVALESSLVDFAGWRVPDAFSSAEDEVKTALSSVAVADCSYRGKIIVEGGSAEVALSGDWPASGLSIGQGAAVEKAVLYRLRWDQFFFHLASGQDAETFEEINQSIESSGELAAVSDVTHGRAELLLIGPKSAELLRRISSLDFDSSRFPDRHAEQTSVAKTRQLVIRRDLNRQNSSPIPAYSIIGGRSFAEYLWETILIAGRELGAAPMGQTALTRLESGDLTQYLNTAD